MNRRKDGMERALRDKAEELLRSRPPFSASNDDPASLIHELRVYQIELEIQNENLRQVQVSFEHSSAKFTDLYEFAPVGYCTIGKDGIIFDVNMTSAELLGFEKKHLIGKPLAVFVYPDDKDVFYALLRNPDSRKTCEIRIVNKRGGVVDVELVSTPHGHGTGNSHKFLVAMVDITVRREIEAGLERTRKELEINKIAADDALEFAENVIDTVREPLLSLDQDLRVVTANRSFYEFFKVTPEETIGQLIYNLGNNQWDIPRLRELLETVLPQQSSFDLYEVEHDFATIGKRIMLLNARQIQRASGREKIILLAIEDITDRSAWERSFLDLNERLQVSNRELKELGHSLSHDLRGPIQSIEAFSRILLEAYAGKLDTEGKQLLNSVKETAHRMYDMIFGLLSISRITRTEIHRDRIDLTALVHTILHDLRKAEHDRGVEILIQDGLFAEGDAKLLRMALDNLIGNAWKFTRKRPDTRIEIGSTENRGGFAFFIRDNGAGFDMKYAGRLFTVFQRLHADDEFEGTGVGLATAQRIIRHHGGEIWAEGEVDKGATFYFTLK